MLRKEIAGLIAVILFLGLLMPTFGINETKGQITLNREETLWGYPEGTDSTPNIWSPFVPAWSSHWWKAGFMVECLYYVSYDNGLWTNWLSTGWTYDEDYAGLTIHIRDGVKWSDGESFDADDVAWTITQWVEQGTDIGAGSIWGEKVVSVNIVDSLNVYLELNEPLPRMHFNLIEQIIVPEHIFNGEDLLTFEWNSPVFTGPYVLIEVTQETILYERNDDYWGNDVAGFELPEDGPKYVYLEWIAGGEGRYLAFERNEIDFVMPSGTDFLTVYERKEPYVAGYTSEYPYALYRDNGHYNLLINHLNYPFNYTEVRKALSYTIDREKGAQVVYGDLAAPAELSPKLVINNMPGWGFDFTEIEVNYDYTTLNPALATELLESVGMYKEGGVWYTSNGSRFEVEIVYTYSALVQAAVQSIASDWAAFGIRTTFKPAGSWPILYDTCTKYEFDAYYGGMKWGKPEDIAWQFEPYRSKYYAPQGVEAPNGWGWWLRYNNTELDQIMDTMDNIDPNHSDIYDLSFRALEIIQGEEPVQFPLWQRPFTPLYNTYYWINWPSADNPYTEYPWYGLDFTIALHHLRSNPAKPWTIGPITYATVWFLENIAEFMGVDGVTYGPFLAGTSSSIPTDNADTFIGEEKASYSPPLPTGLQETIDASFESISRVETAIDTLSTSIAAMSNITTLIYASIGINIVLLIIVIVLVAKK